MKSAAEKIIQYHREAAARLERKNEHITGTVENLEREEGKAEDINSLTSGAADRNRTGTTVARREILSLLRLPIPPQRHAMLELMYYV